VVQCIDTPVDKLQEQLKQNQLFLFRVSTASSAALRAIKEIADQEYRKNNIIVHNLLEGANRDADRDSASVLYSTLFLNMR